MTYGQDMGITGAIGVPQPPYAPLAAQREPSTRIKHSIWTITSIALGALCSLAGILAGSFIALGIGIACIVGGTWAARRRQVSAGGVIYPVLMPPQTPPQIAVPPLRVSPYSTQRSRQETVSHNPQYVPIYETEEHVSEQVMIGEPLDPKQQSDKRSSSQPYSEVMGSISDQKAQPGVVVVHLETTLVQDKHMPVEK